MTKVLAPFIFIAVAIGLFFSYIKPAYDNLQNWQELEAKLDKAFSDADTLKAKHEELRNKWDRGISRDDKEKLDKILPDTIDPVRLVIHVDRLAARHDIVLTNFALPRVQEGSGRAVAAAEIGTLQQATVSSGILSLECEGRYQDFKEWLYELEGGLPFMDLSALTVTPPDAQKIESKDRSPDVYDFKLSLRTYWLPLIGQ